MKKRKFPWVLVLLILLLTAVLGSLLVKYNSQKDDSVDTILDTAKEFLTGEPEEVRELRRREIVQEEQGYQEYYFKLLNDDEKRLYREILDGIRSYRNEFYLTSSDEDEINRVYRAVLKDHPEIFWVHNREQIYITTYGNSAYCLFAPGYNCSETEITEIQASMEYAYTEVSALLPGNADSYEIVKTIYTYLIDHTVYEEAEYDQSIAGVFWKKRAVCAGYAGAMQYLLERFGVPCIYVDGSAKDDQNGHAWNIVQIDGQYYYVDATNGDQPEFLEGDATEMAEHKTIIYDYLCPFPEEYELYYTASDEFLLPECTAHDKNFYVLNQGCFSSYDWQSFYDYCCMRLDNGAAVIRMKFSNREAFENAYQEWVEDGEIQQVAQYYMQLYGLSEIQYHYGVLDHLKTMYFMF